MHKYPITPEEKADWLTNLVICLYEKSLIAEFQEKCKLCYLLT